MDLSQYFSSSDKVYVVRDGQIEPIESSGNLLQTDLILNDNTLDRAKAFDRNVNMLYQKIQTKMDKSVIFSEGQIECDAPHGHILMSEGVGQNPIWVSPDSFMSSLSELELIYNEGLLYDNTTINADLFSSVIGGTVEGNITLRDTSNEIVFNSIDLPLVVDYTIKATVTPLVRTVLGYGQGKIVIEGTDFDDTYQLYISSDVGLVKIDITDTGIEGSNTTVYTDSSYTGAYKAYLFKLDIYSDISSSETFDLKRQNEEHLEPNGNDLIISYYRKECNGTIFNSKLSGSVGLIIKSIEYNFNKNEEE